MLQLMQYAARESSEFLGQENRVLQEDIKSLQQQLDITELELARKTADAQNWSRECDKMQTESAQLRYVSMSFNTFFSNWIVI